MIIRRYLAKEVLITLAALTSILLLIFLSNSFVQYLSRSAGGGIPGVVVLKLMMLEIPNLLGLLLPLGLYMAILLAYGRLYAESEMIVLQTCGYTQTQLIRSTMGFACCIALITGALMIWVSPIIARDRQQLIKGGGISTVIQTIIPQQFRSFDGGKHVFYVSDMPREHTKAEGIFIAKREDEKTIDGKQSLSLLWAETGSFKEDAEGAEFVTLQNGHEYKGTPGTASYQSITFQSYKIRLPQRDSSVFNNDMTTVASSQLLPINNTNPQKAAEIQWRLSIPLMTLILGLMAIPLSRVNPRRGKFAKLLPAIIIYIVYANMMFVGRNGIITGTIPVWLGLWWIHGLFLLIAVGAIYISSRRYT